MTLLEFLLRFDFHDFSDSNENNHSNVVRIVTETCGNKYGCQNCWFEVGINPIFDYDSKKSYFKQIINRNILNSIIDSYYIDSDGYLIISLKPNDKGIADEV